MRILITGSTGLLGLALRARLAAEHDVWGLSRHAEGAHSLACDLTDPSAARRAVEQARPQVIIHTAAQSDVDLSEREPSVATAANVTATASVVAAAEACGARLVYVSTDYVFDGAKGAPYDEQDAPHPLSHYGRTKLQGEQAVQASAVPWMILRPSTLFGPGRPTFADGVLRAAAAGRPVRVFVDQVTSPTYTIDCAEAMARLLAAEAHGIVHVANAGAARRDVFARAVLAVCGYHHARLEEVRLAEQPLPAPRPLNSSLALTRLQQLTHWSPRPWETALAQYLTTRKPSTTCSSAS